MKLLTKIPPLGLDVETIMRVAEGQKALVTYDSDVKSAACIADENQVVFLTRWNGYIRLTLQDAEKVVKELLYIIEDAERRKRD